MAYIFMTSIFEFRFTLRFRVACKYTTSNTYTLGTWPIYRAALEAPWKHTHAHTKPHIECEQTRKVSKHPFAAISKSMREKTQANPRWWQTGGLVSLLKYIIRYEFVMDTLLHRFLFSIIIYYISFYISFFLPCTVAATEACRRWKSKHVIVCVCVCTCDWVFWAWWRIMKTDTPGHIFVGIVCVELFCRKMETIDDCWEPYAK